MTTEERPVGVERLPPLPLTQDQEQPGQQQPMSLMNVPLSPSTEATARCGSASYFVTSRHG